MPLSYGKLLEIFSQRGITSYTIKKENIIGQASYKKIKEGGDIDTRTIAKLCKYLQCQPGDILEYVPDGE
ncbi:helix-turn-helix transcriptional regulator [uncultured Ruminococcus sp.]|uniref:helix-turn-helix domain-containing protein n=1 Tax=uncultured Ruminococcus sp. TaxID=165186 RepID=UPI0025DB1315|nr:helix-turn-helix domain-containing protein [uncultured Ruminococcus sp.]